MCASCTIEQNAIQENTCSKLQKYKVIEKKKKPNS